MVRIACISLNFYYIKIFTLFHIYCLIITLSLSLSLSLLPRSLNMVIDPGNGSVAQFPGSIVNVFIQVFNSNWNFKEAWQEAWLKFQMTVLHVLGAMLCSSKVHAQATNTLFMTVL